MCVTNLMVAFNKH